MLAELEEVPTAVNFLEPVPHEELGLYDYLKVITTPMDLGTCRTKLRKSKYATFADFFHDLDLIWSNCMYYNQEGSQIYLMAKQMQ